MSLEAECELNLKAILDKVSEEFRGKLKNKTGEMAKGSSEDSWITNELYLKQKLNEF